MSIVRDFLPMTSCGHVVRSEAGKVARALAKNVQATRAIGRIDARTLRAALASLSTVACGESGAAVGGYVVLTTAAAGWTSVIVDSAEPGRHWQDNLRLSDALSTRVVYYSFQPHTYRKRAGRELGRYGAYHLTIADRGELVRSVGIYHDDIWTQAARRRWRFYAEGKLQTFERAAVYRARRAEDRFGPALLVEYLAALGLSPFDDTFYSASGSVRGYRVYSAWYPTAKRIGLKSLRAKNGPFDLAVDR